MRPILTTMLIVFTLAACAAPLKETQETRLVTRAFTMVGYGSRDGGKPDVIVAAKAEKISGHVAVCAAFFTYDTSTLSFEVHNFAVGAVSYHLDGEKIGAGADFAAKYNESTALRGKTANCALTDTPWKPAYDNMRLRIKFVSTTVKA